MVALGTRGPVINTIVSHLIWVWVSDLHAVYQPHATAVHKYTACALSMFSGSVRLVVLRTLVFSVHSVAQVVVLILWYVGIECTLCPGGGAFGDAPQGFVSLLGW